VAWGRGNGFASLGLALALGGPLSSTQPRLLSSLRAHLLALLALQGPDGLWRQVLDDADSAGELTVTAMNVAALTTARRRGWLRSRHADLAIALAWKGLQSRVDADGGFRDVCASTPAGPTADFYRQRPMLSGRDDRAAAMWLAAAVS
jgi:rhamnogalacturonyl hydrolase YesR